MLVRLVDWVVASLLSACLLGAYELFIKQAVQGNAILPVLFLGTMCSAAVWLALLALPALAPAALPASLAVESLDAGQHLLLALKSLIIVVSWTCTYFSVKALATSASRLPCWVVS